VTVTSVSTKAVRRHVLDIATLLGTSGVDLLREAVNAPAAGDDWFRLCARTDRLLLPPVTILVTVTEPIVLDGPFEAHMTFEWRMLRHAPVRRRGGATLRMVAMVTGGNAWTDLTVLASAPPRLPGLPEPRWARDTTSQFLTTLARKIEHALSLPAAR